MIKKDLLAILQCPSTGGTLSLHDGLLVSDQGQCYHLKNGIPVFLPPHVDVAVHGEQVLSNDICADAQMLIRGTAGPVLNLSAGGSRTKADNVVEFEYSIFRNTDVVGDAHALPFKNNVFEACICMNAFEHYREPKSAAREIYRVLKPGATLFMHTAALQPLHEPPHHYFNVTRFGLAQWLDDFEVEHIRVADNFNPAFGLAWIISEIDRGVRAHQGHLAGLLFRRTSLGRVMKFWGQPRSRKGIAWEIFQRLDNQTKEVAASGWEARVRKPLA